MSLKPLCCPKCKSTTYSVGIVSEEYADADIVDGRMIFIGQSAMANPIKAHARCNKCGHQWRVRDLGRLPIASLPGESS